VLNVAGNASADLVAHYKLDETEGAIAADSSGNGYDGTIDGNPIWVTGYIDGAMEFDNETAVILPADRMGMTSEIGSVAFWMNYFAGDVSDINTIWWGGDNVTGGGFGPENEMHIMIEQPVANTWVGGEFGFHGQNNPNFHCHSDPAKGDATQPGNQPVKPFTVNDGEWHHIVGTWSMADGTANLYLDGDFLQQGIYGNRVYPLDNMYLGQMANGGRTYEGFLDDVRIYNHALSEEDIHVFGWGPLTLSWRPYPKDNAVEVQRDVILSWWLGSNADKHNVYLGTDVNDINEASIDNPLDVLVSQNQDVNTYDPDGLLDYGQTYYWRVDEVNDAEADSPWKGNVWSFTVLNFIVVDDFEIYDAGDNQIWFVWKDGWGYAAWDNLPAYPGNGTGSAVGDENSPTYMETGTVHAGDQSCPFMYNNSAAPFYSEIMREWESTQDWTVDDVVTLTLWFNGDSGNPAEPLYVAVEDSAGTIKLVTHQDTAAVRAEGWQQWDIALSQFSDAGVDLTAVKTMYIGVGNKAAPQMGGVGFLFFDDIRLYRPAQ